MPKHQKVTTYQKQGDEIKITSKSYYEELAQMLEEIEKPSITSFQTLKQDVEMALEHVLNDGSPKLVLTIEAKGSNLKLTKRYITLKENYPRR
jgi:hypothetical protein